MHVNQSIKIYIARISAPLGSLPRGTPDAGQAEKNSLEKVVELRTGTVWEVHHRSIISPIQVVGPSAEKERVCIILYPTIYGIHIAPLLRDNFSEAVPTQARSKSNALSSL